MLLGFEFTDTGDSYTVELRNSILEITAGPVAEGTPVVSLSAQQLRDVMAGKPAPANAGDRQALAALLGYLDLGTPGFYMHLR